MTERRKREGHIKPEKIVHDLVVKPFITAIVLISCGCLIAIVFCFALIHDTQLAWTVASAILIGCGGFISQVLTLTRLTQIDVRLNGKWAEAMKESYERGQRDEKQGGEP